MIDVGQAITNTRETIAICDEVLADKNAYEREHVKMVRAVRLEARSRLANLIALQSTEPK